MHYIFILGRNVKLSQAEIFSYFKKENLKILNYSLRKNALLIETDVEIGNIIDNLGGTLSIGEVIVSGEMNSLIKNLDKKELYFGTKNKLNYILWNFSDENSKNVISDYLKKRFRNEKLKATEKHLSGFMDLQEKDSAKIISSKKLVDEQFFLFENKKEYFFGKIIQKCDYETIEKRDMNKPVRRQELAISPRLAKIMINLSEVKKNERLLDPFCGIGVILEESLFQNIKVVGIDKDKNAISGANKNLNWFKFEKENYKLINGDSRNVNPGKCNALVTEPYLGDILKKVPTREKANEILREFEKLIIFVINNLKKNVSGKIVFTAPFIKTIKERVSCNIENILKNTGLKIIKINNIGFPIEEFRKGQIIGREIFVLEN